MKRLAIITSLLAAPVAADQANDIKLYDHTKIVTQSIPTTDRRCQDISVPIYQREGPSGSNILLGALLGGVLGSKVVGGSSNSKDKGAALGAIGGMVIANEAAKNQRVVGHQVERHCTDVTVYQTSNVEVYSHSTIRFYIDNKRYVVPFQK